MHNSTRHLPMLIPSMRFSRLLFPVAILAVMTASGAAAQSAAPASNAKPAVSGSTGLPSNDAAPNVSGITDFTEQAGGALYANSCQACHMENGQGAVGAGKYPSLANNANLESGDYPVFLVLHGMAGMPPIGEMMSDRQVAAVINYVRTHFGNNYTDAVTPDDVKNSR